MTSTGAVKPSGTGPAGIHHRTSKSLAKGGAGGAGGAQVAKPAGTDSIAVLLSLEGARAVGGPKYANQDRAFIHEVSPTFAAFGVFDGHGEHGHLVADCLCKSFKSFFYESFRPGGTMSKSYHGDFILSWLSNSFIRAEKLLAQSEIDLLYSGSTASIAIRKDDKVYVAYVGDSKVAGILFHGKKPFCILETPEHNPGSEEELQRIEGTGSRVVESRVPYFSKPVSRIVEAGLSVSRSFGDLAARPYGLVNTPEFIEIPVPPEKATHKNLKTPRFPLLLAIATDGLWDTILPQDILSICTNSVQSQTKLLHSTQRLAETAWRRRLAAEGRADDTTVIIALLR